MTYAEFYAAARAFVVRDPARWNPCDSFSVRVTSAGSVFGDGGPSTMWAVAVGRHSFMGDSPEEALAQLTALDSVDPEAIA